MKYKISKTALNQIKSFYTNVAKKYRHTWTKEDVKKYVATTKQSIYDIENDFIRRKPTISRWDGLFMATSKDNKWNFAYRIKGDTVYVEDACHAQNMHENKQVVKLTESQLKQMIAESVKQVLKEFNIIKD